MIDIFEMLKRKCEDYDPYSDEETSILKSVEKNEDDVFIILREGYTQNTELSPMQIFNNKYFIAEEFSLGRPFVTSESHFSLVHARKKKRKKLRVGIFNGATYDSETMVGVSLQLTCPPKYNSFYQRYINTIEEWINNGIALTDDKNWIFEFAEVDYPDIIHYPRYYSKKNSLVKELLDIKTIDKLSEIAEVYESVRDVDKDGAAVINIDEQRPYRFDNVSIMYGFKTNIRIQIGDILFPKTAVDSIPFLVTRGSFPNIDAYAGDTVWVIRATKILPEYLWLYLISDVAVCINETINSNKIVRFLSFDDIKSFPIIRQDLPDEDYIRICEVLNSPAERRYNTHKISTYEQLRTGRVESTSDILSMELLNTVNLFYSEQLDRMLANDLRELNVCYQNGAYKSVLILAGSILEAVLIDWLSEIDHVDYFSQDFMVSNGHGGQKRGDLIDYINAIKYIKMPEWANEASEAHTIRQRRNLVHAKLCLNTTDINADTCDMVINYLKDVLISRGVNDIS